VVLSVYAGCGGVCLYFWAYDVVCLDRATRRRPSVEGLPPIWASFGRWHSVVAEEQTRRFAGPGLLPPATHFNRHRAGRHSSGGRRQRPTSFIAGKRSNECFYTMSCDRMATCMFLNDK
jgi:hypothetical protein